MIRLASLLFTLIALLSLRAYVVLGGAFFGLLLLRGAYGSLRADERSEAAMLVVFGVALLVVSYRWFAVRWGGARESSLAP